MRDFVAGRREGEFSLYPYAKDLHYRKDGMVTMTLQIYNDERTEEFSFGFMCSPQLRRFLDRTIGDQYEED